MDAWNSGIQPLTIKTELRFVPPHQTPTNPTTGSMDLDPFLRELGTLHMPCYTNEDLACDACPLRRTWAGAETRANTKKNVQNSNQRRQNLPGLKMDYSPLNSSSNASKSHQRSASSPVPLLEYNKVVMVHCAPPASPPKKGASSVGHYRPRTYCQPKITPTPPGRDAS